MQACVLSSISVTWSSLPLNSICQMDCLGYGWESVRKVILRKISLWVLTLTICWPSCHETQIYSVMRSRTLFAEMQASVFWEKQEESAINWYLVLKTEKKNFSFLETWKNSILFYLRGSGSFLSASRTETGPVAWTFILIALMPVSLHFSINPHKVPLSNE